MAKSRPKNEARSKRLLIELAARCLLGAWFGISATGYFINGFAHLQRIDMQHTYMPLLVDGIALLAIGLYSLLLMYLYVIRLPPVSKFAGFGPAAIAIAGGFLISGLMFLHIRADLPTAIKLIAAILVLCGNAASVIILNYLGRSFSILPEGRKLVTTGPYRYVRHPLYVAEAISTIGAMISFWSPAAIALVVAQLVLQLARIHYEEKVMRETFAEYKNYARRTPARLIPGVY